MSKGQGGVNAAVLVAIILGLIVLYIVYLPVADREELLLNKSKLRKALDKEEGNNILLLEFPKRLDEVDDIDKKSIPNVYLFGSTEAKEIDRLNPFSVRNGVFDEKNKRTTFFIDNLDNVDNVLLTFNAKKHKGILMIKLNGDVIYENEISEYNAEPVVLKKARLDRENDLEFSVSPVGIAFWTTNEYILENVKIIGDVTDVSRQKSQNIFALSQTDYKNLEEVTLKFIPYCGRVTDVGVLDVEINSQKVFSAVPVCDDPYRLVIPLRLMNPGENYIVFETDEGSYSIEQIELDFEVEETEEKVYYFEMNNTKWEDITDDDMDVRLHLEFVDDDENKMADISVNGHLTRLDQEEAEYSRSILNWIDIGNNYIEIRPKTTLEIRELRVEVEEKD